LFPKNIEKCHKLLESIGVPRSAHGSADTDMRTLGEQLRREQEDLCAHRGLVPGCEQQTFEMALPPKLRAFCKRITAPLTAAVRNIFIV
jgi:meckelin